MSKILVLTMHKVGSSSMKYALEKDGHIVDRGYEENAEELNLKETAKTYDAIYTAVRDPVARNVSWYFEHYGNTVLEYNPGLATIKENFFECVDHEYPLTWFDDFFLPLLGIDVYKYEFPSNGILFLGKICIMRTDLMKIEHRASTQETRPYGEIYKEFVDWVKFDSEYLDKMYFSKFAKHFFSQKELEERRIRWQE